VTNDGFDASSGGYMGDTGTTFLSYTASGVGVPAGSVLTLSDFSVDQGPGLDFSGPLTLTGFVGDPAASPTLVCALDTSSYCWSTVAIPQGADNPDRLLPGAACAPAPSFFCARARALAPACARRPRARAPPPSRGMRCVLGGWSARPAPTAADARVPRACPRATFGAAPARLAGAAS